MVNTRIILKSIEDAIGKCGVYTGIISSLGNNLKHTLNEFSKSTRELPYEKAIVIDDKGNTLLEFGDKSNKEVSLDNKKILDLLNDNPNIQLHLEHNHPGPQYGYDMDTGFATALSKPDMEMLLYSTGENDDFGRPLFIFNSVTADCSNGSRMTLKRNTPFPIDIERYREAEQHLLDNFNKLTSATNEYTHEITQKDYLDDEGNLKIPTDEGEQQALLDKAHNIQKKYAKKNTESFFKDNVKEFEDLGFELSFGWVKNK